jgi:hypothetical protein
MVLAGLVSLVILQLEILAMFLGVTSYGGQDVTAKKIQYDRD